MNCGFVNNYGHQFSWELVKITVARISEFVVNDLVNTMLLELQLDYI